MIIMCIIISICYVCLLFVLLTILHTYTTAACHDRARCDAMRYMTLRANARFMLDLSMRDCRIQDRAP